MITAADVQIYPGICSQKIPRAGRYSKQCSSIGYFMLNHWSIGQERLPLSHKQLDYKCYQEAVHFAYILISPILDNVTRPNQ